MAFRTVCVGLLLSTLLSAGCGTVANLARQKPGQGGVVPFGGVHQDVWCIRKAASGEFGDRAHPRSDSEAYPQVALMLLCAADLPLSFVGDVVSWPYVVIYSFINRPVPVPPVEVGPTPGRPQVAPDGAGIVRPASRVLSGGPNGILVDS